MKGKAKCSDKWKRDRWKLRETYHIYYLHKATGTWPSQQLLSCLIVNLCLDPVWLLQKLCMLIFTYSQTPVAYPRVDCTWLMLRALNSGYYKAIWLFARDEWYLWSNTHLLLLFNGHSGALTTLKTANFLRVSTTHCLCAFMMLRLMW